ncbi:Nuclear speckle RNA-binding protein A [Zea mays]|uniref:Nuclear speckle RNA-binding protein A n=1 Tax=Zea mays TaxID=4577 RepID=A0A1D6NWE3_MAIZE|nr:Nuclear speckle RNA-binding protein A [Zea mays]
MADAYWRYAAAAPRQQQQQQQPPPSAGGGVAHPGMGGGAPQMAPAGGQQQPMKRPRPTEFSDVPGAPDTAGYYPRDEERAGYRAARDTESLNASYERFLRTGQIQSFGGGHAGEPIRPAVGGNAAYPPGGDPIVLCFVDFAEPTQSAIALDALQGYKFDEHDRNSPNLRLQFARFAGPKGNSGPGGRGQFRGEYPCGFDIAP